MATLPVEAGVGVFEPPTTPDSFNSGGETLRHYQKIELLPEVAQFLETSPLWHEIISEASAFGDFIFHAHVVSEMTAYIFATALSQLKTPEAAQAFTDMFPYVVQGAFLHDIAKASGVDDLRINMLIAPPYKQNGRPDKAILEDHLHALLGGLLCYALGTHPIITELVGGHHEEANGHYITFDNRQQLSYPRPVSRSKGLLQLAQECLKLADLAVSMGFPRMYRIDENGNHTIFNEATITRALIDQLEQQTSPFYTPERKQVLLTETLGHLRQTQKHYQTHFIHTQANTGYFVSSSDRLMPKPPLLIDSLFLKLITDPWYRLRINHFKATHGNTIRKV